MRLIATVAISAMLMIFPHAKAAEINRKVLAVLPPDGDERPLHESDLHRYAEMPLNHLGMIVDYWDPEKQGVPPLAELRKYRGVVTWLEREVPVEPAFIANLNDAIDAGVKFVSFGVIPEVVGTAQAEAERDRLLARMGVQSRATYPAVRYGLKPVMVNEDMFGFEADLPVLYENFEPMDAVSAEINVHLAVDGPVHICVNHCVLAATGSTGGFVSEPVVKREYAQENVDQWVIDPFKFLRAALDLEGLPVPDTTTINGRRIYFSHVDGDGWANAVRNGPFSQDYTTSADAIRMAAIEPYPDLPVSVGLISAELRPDYKFHRETAEAARKIYALPQVEVASHTLTHPFDWGFFEDYDPQRDFRAEYAALSSELPNSEEEPVGLMRLIENSMRGENSLEDQAYAHSHAGAFKRSYRSQPFDTTREVRQALKELEAVIPDDKEPKLYLWSGDTSPFAEIVGEVRKAGLANMNGGDNRFDARVPSVTGLSPLTRPLDGGRERQVYAVNANEAIYTDVWQSHYHAFSALTQTFDNTEKPIRLKPINIYYHAYIAEYEAGLKSLTGLLDDVRTREIIPIAASHYARIAEDFHRLRLEADGPDAWMVLDRGRVNTLRFDAAHGQNVDIAKSNGVLGSRRHNGSLYVALDPAVDVPRVRLASADATKPGILRASLASSRWLVEEFERRRCSLVFAASGYGAGSFLFRGLDAERDYRVLVHDRSGEEQQRNTVATDGDGRLLVSLADEIAEPVEVEISCNSGTRMGQ